MRQGLFSLALALVLVGCTNATKPEPAPVPVVENPPPAETARTLTVKTLTVKSSREVDPKVIAALDAELRSVLEQTRQYVLTEEEADFVLSPRLVAILIREVGAGGAFTMRDLGLDPGPEYVEGIVQLQAMLLAGEEEITETVGRVIRGGDGTPGVSREDRDRDGRRELVITPEGVAALLRPAMEDLVAKLLARTHPEPDPEPEADPEAEPESRPESEPAPEPAPEK